MSFSTSDHLDSNKQYLEKHQPQALENFLESDSPDTDDRSRLPVKTLSGETIDVSIQDRQYRAQTRASMREVDEKAPVVIIGLDRPSELETIACQTGNVPMLYVGFDSRQLRKVLKSIDLSEEPLGERCSVYYPDTVLILFCHSPRGFTRKNLTWTRLNSCRAVKRWKHFCVGVGTLINGFRRCFLRVT